MGSLKDNKSPLLVGLNEEEKREWEFYFQELEKAIVDFRNKFLEEDLEERSSLISWI